MIFNLLVAVAVPTSAQVLFWREINVTFDRYAVNSSDILWSLVLFWTLGRCYYCGKYCYY